jgi:PelA/Pel-15E family pectate lyase
MAGFRNKALTALLFIATLGFAAPPITIHLAGDSTMAEKKAEKRPETGWGEALQAYFPSDKVHVENHARNGRSTRTFIEEGLWNQLIARVNPGDYVFIEFGHNDESEKKVDRYTTPDQYRANLIRFINETRAKQATPVLMTPVSRRKFAKNGTVSDSHREYSGIVRAVAQETKVAFIDMDRKSAAFLMRHGFEGSRQFFLQLKPAEHPNYPDGIEDNTHFSPSGAAEMARLAVEGIRELKLGIAEHLQAPTKQTARETSTALLTPERIAALPAAKRAAWHAYIAASDSVRALDRAALTKELATAGATVWQPAPTDAGFSLQDWMTNEWFAGEAAARLADYIVSYQAPNGGWSKRMAFNHERMRGEAYTSAGNETWLSTLDNGATTTQLEFLAKRLNQQDDARHGAAFLRGIRYLLIAQQPNGCWPQIFPLAGSYHDAITFNDDATINVLRLLRDIANGKYPFVNEILVARAQERVAHGVDCIVATQYTHRGVKTQWGAQHDPLTFQPIKARAYEHASLSGREGANILKFLLEIDNPSPDVVRAVHAAAAWFKQTAINGYTYAYKGDLTPTPGAGPLWARFYELGTDRPIFSDRDAVVRYDLKEIGTERRYGYMWYTDEPASVLKRYERWSAKLHKTK